jgi:hypothetical protein
MQNHATMAMSKSTRQPSRKTTSQPENRSGGEVVEYHPSKIKPEKLEAFREAYLSNGGNAYKAGLAIGMSQGMARARSWRLVRAADFKVADVLELLGHGAERQARKLMYLSDATLPKWNPSKERWDIFEDHGTQMEAVKEINRLRDEYPAPKKPAPPESPVTVIFNTDLERYKDEIYAPKPDAKTLLVEGQQDQCAQSVDKTWNSDQAKSGQRPRQ